MKRKLLLPAMACCITGSLLMGVALADHEKKQRESTYSEKRTDTWQSHKMVKLSQAQGAQVRDKQGQNLGTIHDLLAQPNSGQIEFAILSLSDPEFAGKFTAVPWSLLRQEGANTFVLQADREKFRTARLFTQDQWPDFTRADVANDVYVYYGMNYDRRPAMGGRVVLPGGVEHGEVEVHYDWNDTVIGFPRPAPDGHSTFPAMDAHNKDR